jgi:hypothetical protein
VNKNDKSLISQMIAAGRFNFAIYELLCQQNAVNNKIAVKKMGAKWCCHPDNAVKRLEVPYDLLNAHRGSKILKQTKY